MCNLPEARQIMWTFSLARENPSKDQAGYKLNTQESLSWCCTVWHSGNTADAFGRFSETPSKTWRGSFVKVLHAVAETLIDFTIHTECI